MENGRTFANISFAVAAGKLCFPGKVVSRLTTTAFAESSTWAYALDNPMHKTTAKTPKQFRTKHISSPIDALQECSPYGTCLPQHSKRIIVPACSNFLAWPTAPAALVFQRTSPIFLPVAWMELLRIYFATREMAMMAIKQQAASYQDSSFAASRIRQAEIGSARASY
ncbi:hypothetical protein [Flavisolibacter nicotianae]|uniref:hypothetical protein n=1 Tax=Flavisolibacter nicotianae TaxID=2364882 RepID=UPI0013C450C9|nr:hypothetical protein [Flavisolibacter nicotianae]